MRSGAKHTRAGAHLFFLVAHAARTAVVLRRGPAKQVQMLRWDLATDVVTPGQWLSGRVYEERCDVSPDGRLFVYFCGKFKAAMDTFTAICRPPYFTALALWPDQGTWGGGGFFVTDRLVVLNYGHVNFELGEGQTIPDDFIVSPISEHRALHPDGPTLAESRGWRLVARGVDGERGAGTGITYAEPRVHEKPNPTRPDLALERRCVGRFLPNEPSSSYEFRLIDRSRRTPAAAPTIEALGRLDWAEWDHDGSLLFGQDGRLQRRDVLGPPAPAKVVADLRDNVFHNVIPPESARRWP